jgi:DNA polymerase beta
MPRKKKVVTEPVKVDFKPIIIEDLDILAKQAIKDRNTFKARAYTKIVGQLKNVTTPIYTFEDFNKLELEGVGKGINEKIVEIITTGQLNAANIIREDPATLLFDNLTKIYGVGPVKAKELMNDKSINIKSIDDLRKALLTKPKILNDKQTIGLKYIEDIQKRIPRIEVTEHDKLLEESFKNIYNGFVTTTVGSYRRGLETSGDVDVLVTISPENSQEVSDKDIHTYFKNVIKSMISSGYITDILALGDKKCMAFVRISPDKPARRLDILYTPPNEYPYALLYFTGSDKFNIKFRRKTLDQGYSLNEHGLKKINTTAKPLTNIQTEKEIFDFFGITYVEPINR